MNLTRDDRPLFCGGDLAPTLHAVDAAMKQEIESYDGNRLLNTPVEDVATYFADKFRVEPLALREADISTDQNETKLDTRRLRDGHFMYGDHQREITASAISFFLPFDGDPKLLLLRPSAFTLNPPRATVRENEREIVFTFTCDTPDSAEIKREFENQLRQVQSYVSVQRSAVDGFNGALRTSARLSIEARRARLLQAQNTVGSLGYPMRRRDGAPLTYTAPSVRRRIVPTQPPASSSAFKPEPVLSTDDYEHILNVMQNMALVLERSPSAFASMAEEDLRQHFLVQLNGHYEGTATGETFNVEGKTDILVREGGQNIFIAECKFWRGPSGFAATIDQLLGYASWRDTKTAVVLFNRDTTFSTVLSKIPEALKGHPNFKREVAIDGETRFRSVLRHRNDPGRELVLTVLVFDVPK